MPDTTHHGLIITRGRKIVFTRTPVRPLISGVLLLLFVAQTNTFGQQSAKMGEVRFSADNQTERDSGVWIDGKYAGYVKELKGDRKVMLPAGEHEVSIRQAGYKDLTKKIAVEPGQVALRIEAREGALAGLDLAPAREQGLAREPLLARSRAHAEPALRAHRAEVLALHLAPHAVTEVPTSPTSASGG